ncbi:hypothetical protein O181_081666 [Austropuccinia psidii MF-1]|uniref:Uncharacterized protein n=1 Tax=Austropuccinia psidii MF-1 TaxID=1389203 RepID=A0A9Q3FKN0_9BASI|nr:hypothetical protein [Austropuccinia psidii MF-1]
MAIEIKSEIKNDQYSEDSFEDFRNKIFACFKDREFIKEYNREESNQTDEFQICEISQDPPRNRINHADTYEDLWKAYIKILQRKKTKFIFIFKTRRNLIEVEASPLEKYLMNTILSNYLNPQSLLRIYKLKTIFFDEESFLNYHDEIYGWELPASEEEPDFIIIPYIELNQELKEENG